MLFLYLDDDIVGGTDSIKRALIQFFFELNKQQEKDGRPFLKRNQATTALRDKEQALSVLATSMVDADMDSLL